MAGSRYTFADLERDVDRYNEYLEKDGIPRRFSAGHRNGYAAIDMHHTSEGDDWTKNLDCNEPPRVLRDKMAVQYGHWYREFGEGNPSQVTRQVIRTRNGLEGKYYARTEDGRMAIFTDKYQNLEWREGHHEAARAWIEKHMDPERNVVKYGGGYGPYMYWPILIRGTDSY